MIDDFLATLTSPRTVERYRAAPEEFSAWFRSRTGKPLSERAVQRLTKTRPGSEQKADFAHISGILIQESLYFTGKEMVFSPLSCQV